MRNLKRALSLTLASVMLLGMMVMGSSALSFNDADDISNVTAATVLEELGVMQGDGQGNFMPEQTVTRAQMAILICRILYGDKLNISQFEGTTQYNDVAANAYYTGYINLATQLGIINGYGDGRFGPDDTVTTAQAALMLCRALGYFKANELATGDWALAAIAQASKIEMFGNLKLSTNEGLARDNVCEMVFNTMTKAVPVQYSERWDLYYTDSTNILGGMKFDYEETLAYRNFDLVYDEGKEDAFGRPATEWGIGLITGEDDKGNVTSATIKTSFIKAMDEADLTYTAAVKVSDIYKDLGLADTVKVENVTVYVDGIDGTGDQIARPIRRNDTDNKYGGNGILTQVFYFPGARTNVADKIVITEVTTWFGEIARTVAASGSKDAYVEITTADDGANAPSTAKQPEKFETGVSYAGGEKVLYTYSMKDKEVTSVKTVEGISGNVSEVIHKVDVANDKVTLDGQQYTAAKNMLTGRLDQNSVGLDYTIYLDEYGYVLHASEEEFTDYALVLAIESANDVGFTSNRAKLVLSDGSVVTATLEKNYKTTASIAVDDVVSYKVNDGVYTLKKVADADVDSTKATDDADFKLENSKAAITATSGTTIYGNSNTIFVVYNYNNDSWDSYTGIKNAPDIAAKELAGKGSAGIDNDAEKNTAWWYCKSGSMTTVLFVKPGDDALVENGKNNLLYLAHKGVSQEVSNKEGDYFVFHAVVNGEIQDVRVADDVNVDGVAMTPATFQARNLKGLFSSYSTDKRGVITSLTSYTTSTGGTKFAGIGIGSDRISGASTVIVNNNAEGCTGADVVTPVNYNTWTLHETCAYYSVDEDGNITTTNINVVNKNNDNHLYYIVDNGQITTMIVEIIDTKNNAATPAGSITPAGAQSVGLGATLELTADMSVGDDGTLSYQWYQHTTNTLDLAHISSAKKLTGETSKDLTITGKEVGDEFYYYCVVTNNNDKVDGKGEAQKLVVSGKVTTTAAPGEKVWVRVQFQKGAVSGSDDPVKAVSFQAEVDGAGYGTLTKDDLTSIIPAGYKIADSGSGLPADIAPSATTQVIKVKVELKDVKTVEILDKPTGDFLLKYAADATNVPAQVKAAGMTVKVTFTDDTDVTVDADDSILTWTATPTADDNAKVTCNTVDSANLAFKVYATVAKSAITAPSGWTIDSITTSKGKIGDDDVVTLDGTVTVKMHKTTAAKYDETAKDAEFTGPNLSAITGATADTVTVAIDDSTTDTNAVINVTFSIKTAIVADALTSITIAAS